MHEVLLNQLDRCAERRNFFWFGLIENELHYYYTQGHEQSFAISHCPAEAEFIACLPEGIQERYVKAKKKLLPNYRVDVRK